MDILGSSLDCTRIFRRHFWAFYCMKDFGIGRFYIRPVTDKITLESTLQFHTAYLEIVFDPRLAFYETWPDPVQEMSIPTTSSPSANEV